MGRVSQLYHLVHACLTKGCEIVRDLNREKENRGFSARITVEPVLSFPSIPKKNDRTSLNISLIASL